MEIEFGKITYFFRPTMYYIRIGNGPLHLYNSVEIFWGIAKELSHVYKEVNLDELHVFMTRNVKKHIVNEIQEEA